ncbi:ribose 5-phosphate isomerase B [Propionispira arboris]|uniref:Ribose 5-phosphate isomerase B n=1 Tax=Propionispira arboris TaxID=84035 RepID=A0A1H6YZ34_9FIRM|nr:ribose 5-phosphate isomerase B [Propionispira arboris]SEJ46471.1 ribose 5-phosphate isomerase B [Propionispira arboris]
MQQIIVIGSDHAAFELKTFLTKQLQTSGFIVEDVGTYNQESVDYPQFAQAVAENIANARGGKKGILLCGTGVGMSIMANKVKGVRAALIHDLFSAKLTREHNDSNVLCMGARVIAASMAWEIVNVWLSTPFIGGKHHNRIAFITNYEQKNL